MQNIQAPSMYRLGLREFKSCQWGLTLIVSHYSNKSFNRSESEICCHSLIQPGRPKPPFYTCHLVTLQKTYPDIFQYKLGKKIAIQTCQTMNKTQWYCSKHGHHNQPLSLKLHKTVNLMHVVQLSTLLNCKAYSAI